MITVMLCELLERNMDTAEDTLAPLVRWETNTPIPCGTVYRYDHRLFTHACDMPGDMVVYVEQTIVDAPVNMENIPS